jgi:DNA replication protein DnaC
MILTTTTFTCPKHGDQSIESLEFIDRRMCNVCVIELQDAVQDAERAHRGAMNRWTSWARCGIPRRHQHATLDNWHPTNKSQETALGALTSWASSIEDRQENRLGLVVVGPVGVGKTHVLSALTTACHQVGICAFYVSWPDALERHKATFNNRDHADRDLLDKLARVPVLALDELGVRAGSEFDQGLLFQLIDSRYRDQLVTLAASNLTESTLDAIGERAADRLRECAVTVSIIGASQRSNVRALQQPAIERPEPWSVAMTVTINGEQEVVHRSEKPSATCQDYDGALANYL